MGALNHFENIIQTSNYDIEHIKRKTIDIVEDKQQLKDIDNENNEEYDAYCFGGIFKSK